MTDNLIIKELVKSCGASESSEVVLIADTKTGETELVISKTFTERYPITDHGKVMQLYENLNSGGGRKCWKLIELT